MPGLATAPSLRSGIVLLLARARAPLPAAVIRAALNRSERQTERALVHLIRAGQIVRVHRAGEGRRGAVYALVLHTGAVAA